MGGNHPRGRAAVATASDSAGTRKVIVPPSSSEFLAKSAAVTAGGLAMAQALLPRYASIPRPAASPAPCAAISCSPPRQRAVPDRARHPRKPRPQSLHRGCCMDMLTSARYLKAHQLAMGKLGVIGFCWGGSTTNYLAVTLGADMHAGVPFYGCCRDLRRALDQGAAAHPPRRERRAHQRDVPGLRDGAECSGSAARDA